MIIKVQVITYKYLKMVMIILYPAKIDPLTVPDPFEVPILFLGILQYWIYSLLISAYPVKRAQSHPCNGCSFGLSTDV